MKTHTHTFTHTHIQIQPGARFAGAEENVSSEDPECSFSPPSGASKSPTLTPSPQGISLSLNICTHTHTHTRDSKVQVQDTQTNLSHTHTHTHTLPHTHTILARSQLAENGQNETDTHLDVTPDRRSLTSIVSTASSDGEYHDVESDPGVLKNRVFVYRELVSTEQDYIKDLSTVIDVRV